MAQRWKNPPGPGEMFCRAGARYHVSRLLTPQSDAGPGDPRSGPLGHSSALPGFVGVSLEVILCGPILQINKSPAHRAKQEAVQSLVAVKCFWREGRRNGLCFRAGTGRDLSVFAALKALDRECQSAVDGAGWRRSRSTLAIAAGPGHSSMSHWGSGSSRLLNGSTSSSSPRPFGNNASARGIS